MKMRLIPALLGGIALLLVSPAASAAQTAQQKAAAAAKKAQQQQQEQLRQAQAQAKRIQAQQRTYMAQQQKLYQAQQKAYQEQQQKFLEQQKKAIEAQQQKEAAAKKQAAEAPAKPQKDTKTAADAGKVNQIAEKRPESSTKRIQQSVNKGYLTADELAKLGEGQVGIEKLQPQFAAEGTVSKDEAAQLRTALKDTSLAVWTQKHDAAPMFCLGENLRLNPDIAARLGDENLSKADARKFLKDFRTLCQKKKQLNGDLADPERSTLQKQYDDLLNQCFSLK